MWELRLILLLIGVVVIAGVYLLSRQNRAPRKAMRAEPRLGEAGLPGTSPAEEPRLILALHVVPRDGQFAGSDVLDAVRAAGLQFGRHDIFHRLAGERPLFSVANMFEPGSFRLDTLADTSVAGLTLFLVLPGPGDGVSAYADMLVTARKLAAALGGEVLDESHSTLTRQTAHHVRERIIAFQHQIARRQAPRSGS